jgi:hypothetical protein
LELKPIRGAIRPPLGLTVGATVACGLVTLGAAITSRGVHTHALLDGRTGEFVVTSARDAGPGTLRDAILAADRLSSRCHIVIKVPSIAIGSALPALINPHGVEVEAAGGAGTIDADRETKGSAIQIKSPGSSLTGLRVLHAHGYGILVDAPGVLLVSVTVQDSKVGIMLGASASGAIVRTSLLQHDETGLVAESGIRDVTLASDIFRLNTQAGLWFVGAAAARRAGTADAAAADPLIRVLDTVFEQNATGVVLANEAGLLRKDRFIDNQSALTILGGAATIDNSEIRGSQGDAVSVVSGRSVVLTDNMLVDNKATALTVRDSDVRIETNTFARNGLGLVVIGGPTTVPLVKDNRITDNRGDGIMLIGGALLLQDNQLLENRGAGLRPLDFVQGNKKLAADPRLHGNVFHANGQDVAPTAIYRLKDGA